MILARLISPTDLTRVDSTLVVLDGFRDAIHYGLGQLLDGGNLEPVSQYLAKAVLYPILIMIKAALWTIDCNVENVELLGCFLEELGGFHTLGIFLLVSFDGLIQFIDREIGIKRLVAHGDDDSLPSLQVIGITIVMIMTVMSFMEEPLKKCYLIKDMIV